MFESAGRGGMLSRPVKTRTVRADIKGRESMAHHLVLSHFGVLFQRADMRGGGSGGVNGTRDGDTSTAESVSTAASRGCQVMIAGGGNAAAVLTQSVLNPRQ
jgi:hypothetical protein